MSEIKPKRKEYVVKGIVYGEFWGGGKGGYRATKITGSTREEVIKTAEKMLDDGSLDGGMGFQRLIGAALLIEETTFVEVGGLEYSRKEYEEAVIGKLTEDEEEHLSEALLDII